MKANLTRGNSVTENYQPHPVDILFCVALERFKRPLPGYPKGTAIVGERGQELIKLPTGTHIIPHHETLKLLKNL